MIVFALLASLTKRSMDRATKRLVITRKYRSDTPDNLGRLLRYAPRLMEVLRSERRTNEGREEINFE